MKSYLTPLTLQDAVRNASIAYEASHGGKRPAIDAELSALVTSHVRDFAAQKFNPILLSIEAGQDVLRTVDGIPDAVEIVFEEIRKALLPFAEGFGWNHLTEDLKTGPKKRS